MAEHDLGIARVTEQLAMAVDLDAWIATVKRCEHLEEEDLKSLCEYVRAERGNEPQNAPTEGMEARADARRWRTEDRSRRSSWKSRTCSR